MSITFSIHEETVNNPIECCVCFDTIQKTNNCTTPCGHMFCFDCIVKCINKNNKCPYCRTMLDLSKDSDSESSENDEDGISEEDFEYVNYDENEDLLEILAERFQNKGYTIKDALCISSGFTSNKYDKYDYVYMEKITDMFNELMDEIINEKKEQKLFACEDLLGV